jgi:hypothetical protein
MLRIGISSSSFGSSIAAGSDLMIEITRIDCAWPTDAGTIELPDLFKML